MFGISPCLKYSRSVCLHLANELDSLGIEPKQKKELNDNKEEVENLADIIKQAMFQDYKVAYSEEGNAHKEEVQSTVTVG
jgi:hypothetical protein